MKQATKKPYWEMTTEELAAATKRFDKPLPLSRTRPLTKQERARFERMRRAPKMSVFVTRNADGVFIRLPPDLLRRCQRYAAGRKMTLSDVITRSLKGMLAIVE